MNLSANTVPIIKANNGIGKNQPTTLGKGNSINIFHQNIQSLRNKTLEIEVCIKTLLKTPDIICLTEHWLTSPEEPFTKINGYNLASCWSRNEKEHGGSCIYTKNEINFRERTDIKQVSVESAIECSCIELDRNKLLILSIYRPPQGDIDVFFESLINIFNKIKAKMVKYTVVLCGDFNIDLLSENKNKAYFIDLMNSYGFNQKIHKPTRETSTSQTIIDNIFINTHIDEEGEVIPTSLSDHHAQTISLPKAINNINTGNPKSRCFSKQKIEYFRQELIKEKWEDIYNIENDPDMAYKRFSKIFTDIMDQIFTVKTLKSRKQHTWITQGIKISCKEKRKLYIQKNKGQISREKYENYTKILKRVICAAKKSANERYIREAPNKTKATWSVVSEITRKKTNNHQSLNLDHFNKNGETIKDTLNNFNNFFINACPNINNNDDINLDHVIPNNANIRLEQTNPFEVYNIIHSLKDTKAVGIDRIPVKLLKSTADLIAEPLAYLINLTLASGIFPSLLKISVVKPIHKKGDKKNMGNYRPISLLPNISKIFEKIIYLRLISFIDRWKILTDQQNGFRKNMSTIRAMYQLLSKVLESLNNRNYVSTVLLDLSKAFDSVDYKILLLKLEKYGIQGTCNRLIKSYLQERSQCIIQNDNKTGHQIKSEMETLIKGVPQGSILGPLLFILYSNDLPNCIDDHVVLYADDTSIVFSQKSHEDLEAKIQSTMSILERWFVQNNMLLNVDKTNIIKFSYPIIEENNLIIQFEEKIIQSVSDASFLGLQIDRRLDWRPHINLLSKKIAQYSYALKIIANSINKSVAKISYHAYVQSRIQYGIIFWGNSTEVDRIFILQKRCIRNIYNLKQRESCKPLFMSEKILTLTSIMIFESVKFVCENKHFFQSCDQLHKYSTRNKSDLYPIIPTTTYIQKNVYHSLIKIYNKVPLTLRNLDNKVTYKKLKNLLLRKAYYSLGEFFEDQLIDIC